MFQKIKNTLWHLPKNFFLTLKYGFPARKLTLIGITGTDGKTTTCTLIHQILMNAGFKTGLISTIGAKIGENSFDTQLHMTSPDPNIIQKILRKMVDEKVTHAVIEVTAHALDQYRFLNCKFAVSAITNTSHEHLDYFKDMDSYVASKIKLFKRSSIAILNKDDLSFKQISSLIKIPYKTFSVKRKSDYRAKNIKLAPNLLKFKVNKLPIQTDSHYYYQTYNILTALAVIDQLKIDPKILISTVKKFPEITGRGEEVQNDFKFKTLIDFAHTPAGLESTLSSLKEITPGNLITIFGATGGRDQSKRPIMGQKATQIANTSIITADDTRNEKVEEINNQIINGIDKTSIKFVDYKQIKTSFQFKRISRLSQKHHVYLNIPNRQEAFNFAIKLAQANDTVIACGKGHEKTILHGKTEYPWSEAEAFRTAFRFKNLSHDNI